jgi:predicted phosphodiesterase
MPTPDHTNVLAALTGAVSYNQAAGRLDWTSDKLRRYVARNGLRDKADTLLNAGRVAADRPALRAVEDPAAEVSREEMLAQELAEARRALAAARSDDVREARVIEAIGAHLPVKQPRYAPTPILKPTGKQPHTLVLLWSDMHAAEVVSAEETNGANEYNWEIMLRRHDELRRGVFSFAERFGPVERLVVAALGDGLSGNIHQELAETNEMPLAEATVQLGLDGAEFVESLAEEIPEVHFAGVVGNHPRYTVKMRAKGRFDNGDWLWMQILKQRLSKHPRITVDVPKAQKHPVMVYDRRLLLMHGDGIRSSMVGVPWGGIIRHTDRLRNQYTQMGMPVDHFLLGHYHEANVVKNRRIIVNGSVKGVDEYSLEAFGGGESPAQVLLPFHPDYGMVGAQYIDLEPQRPVRHLRAVAA